jgi:hypothetical protein
MTEPARPPALPAAAAFDAESSHWQLAERNSAGALHGAFVTFRASGRPLLRGTYVEGKPEGIWSRFTDDAPDAEPLRRCCVPPGARELRSRFRAGVMLDETFYDARGKPLNEDGTPWPERPAGVPEDASYEQSSARFLDRIRHADDSATLRYFNLDGTLEEELDVTAGRLRARRRFDAEGQCVEETTFDEQGAPHGAYVARFAAGDGPWLDAQIRELRGQHEHGQTVGTWTFLGADGATRASARHGRPLDADALARVSGREDAALGLADLWALARAELDREPRVGAAWSARALARSGDLPQFESVLAAHRVAQRAEIADLRALEAAGAEGASPSSLLGALLAGAAPAIILRTLASSLAGHAPAALEYFDASVLIAPEQEMANLARGLLCVEHGDPRGALAAAALVAPASHEAAEFLRGFVRVSYQDFAFVPARDGVEPQEEELAPLASEQPLEAVRRGIGVYATRIAHVRAELARRATSDVGWLPPDTSALLPDGPLELRRYVARIEDEGEEGSEVSEVAVDETVSLAESTRRLLVTARSDWAALGWLCWSAGLDGVALPDRLVPRLDFAAAAHQATTRCWRAHDRVRTAGLVALARHVPGFTWEGMAVDAVPTHLIEVVAAEYLEVRAQFLWQLFPQNQSPFQSDLRRV